MSWHGSGERGAATFLPGGGLLGKGTAARTCVQERGMLCPFAHQTSAFKHWNRLRGEVVHASSLSVLKRRLASALNNEV